MNLIDFIIGVLLVNAMPHFIFGITKTHFLGMFGYSSRGNILYAVVQFILSIVLYGVDHQYAELLENGYLVGGLLVMVLYFILGKPMLKYYQKK